jgi:uncharacterized membrane protein
MLKILLIILLLDMLYLKFISYPLLKESKFLENLTFENIRFRYIILCYLFISFGIYYFIINQKKSVYDAFILGIITYGIYDFTTLSIFKDYDSLIALIDILWGGILFSLTTYIYYKIN